MASEQQRDRRAAFDLRDSCVTSLRGKLLRTAFETAIGTRTAMEWFVEGTQILSPRWFAAARLERASPPPAPPTNLTPADLAMAEATAGFRINPAITLRASDYTRRTYGAAAWDHQVGASIVVARRWW